MNQELLEKLMTLSKIELDGPAQETMLHDLGRICDWIEQLQAVNTDGIEPLTTLSVEQPLLREDTPQPSLDHQKALSASMYSNSDYFRVPNLK